MAHTHSLAEKIRRGESIPLLYDALLRLGEPLVRLGMQHRLHKPRTRVDATVISFGNITAGGTGKTPAVIERAQQELAAGHRVAVLTRGYGSRKTAEPLILPPDTKTDITVDQIGDEPALIAHRAPGVYLVKSADRVAGAKLAIEKYGCDTLILDDGFQAVTLERDENIVVIDSTNPFGNGHLLPRGILREPLTGLQRATHLLLTRCDQNENISPLLEKLQQHCPDLPLRQTTHTPTRLWRICDGKESSLEDLHNQEITALSAIGNPEGFHATLTQLGAILQHTCTFPDHAPIPLQQLPSDTFIITTEKDAMRLPTPVPENIWALGIDLLDYRGSFERKDVPPV